MNQPKNERRKLRATVLGSGTSAGVPVIGCQCPVCLSTDPKDKRLRSSIVLRNESTTLLIDCGSDFRQQALGHQVNRLDALLVTHAHSDHVAGVDEIRLYNWYQGHSIPVYANSEAIEGLKKRFDYIFYSTHQGGGISQIDLKEINDHPFEAAGFQILPLPVIHAQLPVLGFRIGDFAYITDASEIGQETIDRLRGVRILIMNALRHRPHPSHQNVSQALEIVEQVNPEQTYFTHINHDLGHSTTNNQLPKGVELAWDGLEFDIDPDAELLPPINNTNQPS